MLLILPELFDKRDYDKHTNASLYSKTLLKKVSSKILLVNMFLQTT